MKKIAVFHTGGTISMKKDDSGGVNMQGGNALVNGVAAEMEQLWSEEQIFGVASPQITEQHMFQLRQEILGKIKAGAEGIVVTHGTDTLEETAYFLDITVPHTVPVVLIGAMRSFNDIGSDAVKNYQSAITVASSDEAKDIGTVVVMNEEIHAARSVTKTHSTNLATFQSPGFGYIGTLNASGKVIIGRKLLPAPCYDISGMTKKVMLIKSFAGLDSTVFDAFDALEEKQGHFPIDGLVLEAFGVGNIPARIVGCLQKLEKKGIPIVLGTRCLGGMPQPVYKYDGGGMSLKTEEVKSIIFANGLNGPKARLKLAVLLETTSDIATIEAEFAKH